MPDHPFKVELISWGETERLIDKLASHIRESGFIPDVVIAIARGGYVPARLLCDQLDIYQLTSIRISHYLAGAHRSEQAQLVEPQHSDISQANVLLVDDVDDSGDTLELARQHLSDRQPKQLKIAVVHHKLASSLIPDYYAHKIVKWRWLTYPWALYEDVCGFLDQLSPPATNPQEAARRLQAQFQISVPRRVMAAVFHQSTNNPAVTLR
ncbi:MAG: phosphoribosyltransferase [Thiohalophilus sp.]